MIGNIQCSNEIQALIKTGKSYSLIEYYTFGADETKNFVFDPTTCTCDNIYITSILFSATAGAVLVNYYAGTIASDNGTVVNTINRNFNANTSSSIIRLNPTVSNNGLLKARRLIPATGATPVVGVGQVGKEENYLIIDSSIKYMLSITNNNGNDTLVQFDFNWSEI